MRYNMRHKIIEPVGDLAFLLEISSQLEEKKSEVVLKRILIYRSEGNKITRNKFRRTLQKSVFFQIVSIRVVLYNSLEL